MHDPLLATALAIETRDGDGTIDQAVWVSCDLAVIRRKVQEKMREHVRQRLPELDVQKIILSATHTHTAPALTDADETDLHPYDFLGSWAYRIPAERDDVMRPAEYQMASHEVVSSWLISSLNKSIWTPSGLTKNSKARLSAPRNVGTRWSSTSS